MTYRNVLMIAATEEHKVPKEEFREDHLLCPDLGLFWARLLALPDFLAPLAPSLGSACNTIYFSIRGRKGGGAPLYPVVHLHHTSRYRSFPATFCAFAASDIGL